MQRVEVRLEDDLTGGPADETVKFGLEGMDYELDLNTRHAAEFRRQLAPFVERARRVRPQRSRARARTAASRERSREIRAWAEEQGYSVAEHGRLPANIIYEYDVAHGGQQSGERSAPRPAGRKVALERTTTKRQGRATPSRRRRTTRLKGAYGRREAPKSAMAGTGPSACKAVSPACVLMGSHCRDFTSREGRSRCRSRWIRPDADRAPDARCRSR